ncbi:MAG: prepilin peptidase [Patescibacteria group bacterium]|nr:prepilin peptidase [Patescibacteria group bacterium]
MWLLGFVLGTILGSFAKATSDRIQEKVSFKKRSYCQSCKKTLRWYDLFPVFSFLILRGHCRFCHRKIPLGNFLAELVMGILIALVFLATLPTHLEQIFIADIPHLLLLIDLLFRCFIVTVLAIIFLTDLKLGIIPDRITYPAMIISLIYLILTTVLVSWNFYHEVVLIPFGKYLMPPYSAYLTDNIQRIVMDAAWSLGAAVISALVFFFLIVITRGRGMGWGDVKYVFLLGLALGYPNIVLAIFLAFISGAVIALLLMAFKKRHFGQTIPFGPFLSLGAFTALLFGAKIINWYITSLKIGS